MTASSQHDTPGVSSSGVMFALASLFCWSITPLLIKSLTDSFDVWESNGWRYGAAAMVWLPALILYNIRGKMPRSVWRKALIPAAFSLVAQVAFVSAFYQIEPGMLTFGLRIQIVATAIGAWILFPGERPIIRRPSFLGGALAVMLGTVGVAYFAPAGDGSDESLVKGVLLAMTAGVGYACYAMAVRRCLVGVPARISFAVISLYVGSAMVALMFWKGADPVGSLVAMGSMQWVIFVLSVLFGIAFGHVIYFIAMEKLGVAPATGVVQLQPLAVAAASYFIFDEILNTTQIVCGVLAVAGAGLMLWTQHAVAKKRKLDVMRELDELPIDPAVAMEEAARATSPEN